MIEVISGMIRGMRIVVVVAALACLALSGCVFYLNPQCDDLIRNGNETDIDCGAGCKSCDIGDRCNANTDCYDSFCDDGRCTPFPCDNGRKDGQETDVDCGGPECRKCSGGRVCQAGTDCFTGNCVASTDTCYELPSVAFAEQVSYPSGNKTYIIFSADLNGDGFRDIIAGNELDSTLTVFLNNGGVLAGTFRDLGPRFPTGEYATGGSIGDFNNDGIPDIVTSDYHGDSVSVLVNTTMAGKGTGLLAPRFTQPTVADSETSNLAIGDLNGDRNLDVIATNPQSSSVSVILGNGDGTIAPAVDIPIGIPESSEPYSVAIGDFDKNGTADMAVADNSTLTIRVRLGRGDGTFEDEVPYLEGGTPSYIIITHDVNLDGNLDLVCTNRESDDISVLLGRGDGNFRKPFTSNTGEMTGPYSIAVADFNLDGVPDVVTANYRTGTASVLLGIGNGRFEPPLNAGTTGMTSYGVTTGDFDNDGMPDFAVANAISNDVTVKLNRSPRP
jgi:FG-GAP-like repeat